VVTDPVSEPLYMPIAPGFHRRMQALIEVLLCSSVPTQLAIGAVLRLMGIMPTDAAGHVSLRFVLTLSIADTVLLIAMMVALMRSHGESAALLWTGRRPAGREVIYGLLTVPIVFITAGVLLNAVRLFVPWLHNVASNPLEQLAASPGEAAMLALVAILAGGVREELQRAFLLHRFEQHLGGATVGVIVLSVGFGLGHYVQGWDAVLTTGVLGAIWAVIYLKRRSSIGPIVSHATFNSLEILRTVAGLV
jgi:membrane protease YdiL (CAAX protease family)